jgi:UDP-N-acetylmuramoyl-tripeptide--D-alanyl-D-alanine ligase
MIDFLKSYLYFFVAWYFRFWAQIQLAKWNPQVIVITGSSGKTTLMHFVESQLSSFAKFSHHANSAIGVPFDILNLHRKTFAMSEWLGLFLKAPLNAFAPSPSEKFYVVECDADRPNEGKFLSSLLKPDFTLWVSLSRTHSVNFDKLVGKNNFKVVEDAIAYEYGYFLEHTKKLSIINGDSPYIQNQRSRSKSPIVEITQSQFLQEYSVNTRGTHFVVNGGYYDLPDLHPQEIFYAIAMTRELVEYLKLPFDSDFSRLQMPPGRSSIFHGIKNTTLIDSTYNANLISMRAALNMFEKLDAQNKWVVLGDMRELGEEDKEEHERLAQLLSELNLQKIILMGASINKYTYPYLKNTASNAEVLKLENHSDILKYLRENIQGGETILFKASQSQVFEGFIEPFIENSEDLKKLPRREQYWINYRNQKGL